MGINIEYINTEYKQWVVGLKKQIRAVQIKASMSVNEEMLRLYWNIGFDISSKNIDKFYGSNFFENLSRDLKTDFPNVLGFSQTNLKYMKRFYEFYSSPQIRHKLGDEFESILFSIPWRHHIEIFTRSKSLDEALFFIQKTRQYGWGRAVLVNMMSTKMFETQGNTINNFALTLPKEDSECAKEVLRDNYKLDFLALNEHYTELELQKQLETHLIQFLTELGKGFAFVGRQVRLEVAGDEFFVDMLFYNLKLRRYIVVELKVVKFQPEFISKLNFYCNAVNHLIKEDIDKDTIGLLICKEKNDLVAQWTVERSTEPIGISTYDISKDILPTEQEIKNSLGM